MKTLITRFTSYTDDFVACTYFGCLDEYRTVIAEHFDTYKICNTGWQFRYLHTILMIWSLIGNDAVMYVP